MGTELTLNVGTIFAFLLVLTRVSAVFIFVPLPGIKSGFEMARTVLAVSVTLALYSRWPVLNGNSITFGRMLGWMIAEAALGIAVGVTVSLLTEMFQMGAQIIGMQAGYSFASTIDPTSGADSTVLLTFSQIVSGLLFFGLGLDRVLLLAFTKSLETRPPGQFAITETLMHQVIQASSMIFSVGLRLVLPLLALLLMVDISLALLSRLNSQLQMVTLAFPIKMLVSLVLLGWLFMVFPKLYAQLSGQIFGVVRSLLLT